MEVTLDHSPDTNTQEPTQIELDVENQTRSKPEKPAKTSQSACACLSLEYWQEYFDVSQSEVKDRLIASINPQSDVNKDFLESKTDLFGPLWISATLCFVLVISKNFLQVLANMIYASYTITYDFSQVGKSTSIVFGFLAFAPTILSFGLRVVGKGHMPVMKAVCIYGYSFMPVLASVLLGIAPLGQLYRDLLLLAGSGLSGYFMFRCYKEKMEDQQKLPAPDS